jgi:hypothetical protein
VRLRPNDAGVPGQDGNGWLAGPVGRGIRVSSSAVTGSEILDSHGAECQIPKILALFTHCGGPAGLHTSHGTGCPQQACAQPPSPFRGSIFPFLSNGCGHRGRGCARLGARSRQGVAPVRRCRGCLVCPPRGRRPNQANLRVLVVARREEAPESLGLRLTDTTWAGPDCAHKVSRRVYS